ncbi:F-box protein SKIP24 isoform X4 [Actinidia eriantha]|uniref:F-box protein SKIP24 isoform X4 n=1 Tax=Actinidia eriantha TaxID=165200 RepID=UPI00258AF509|nr:F-box protein SKIP24 isoform X4 [Actinidia eriantha]
MSGLPDELLSRILEIGIQNPNSSLTYKDLCCLSIASRRLHRLSNDEALWSSLISSDFPLNQYPTLSSSSSSSSSSKALYKIRFERDRDRKLAAHRRAVLRIESQVAEHSRKLQEIKLRSVEETEKMKATVAELSNLRKVRQASVALNVWQPEVIRGRHKQIVEQCVVPADSRIHALEMELRLCKQQIAGLDKAYKDERKRLDAAKEQLTSTKYHPLRNYNLASDGVDKYGMKRKKFKKEHINGTECLEEATYSLCCMKQVKVTAYLTRNR